MGEEQQKWISKLLGYTFEFKYKSGKENSAANGLSRQMEFMAMTTIQCRTWDGLEEEVLVDEKLRTIVQDLLGDPNINKGYTLKKGRLYHGDSIVLPKSSPRIAWVLQQMHDTVVGGHSVFS